MGLRSPQPSFVIMPLPPADDDSVGAFVFITVIWSRFFFHIYDTSCYELKTEPRSPGRSNAAAHTQEKHPCLIPGSFSDSPRETRDADTERYIGFPFPLHRRRDNPGIHHNTYAFPFCYRILLAI